MITLGIETSCDETAICLLETEASASANGQSLLSYKILGNLILSQVELHRQYGGVFPIMAKREHAKNLVPLLEKLIHESGIAVSKIKMSAGKTGDDTTSVDLKNGLEKILKEKEPELLDRLLQSKLLGEKPAIDQIAVTKGPGLEPALWVGVNCARALSELWNVPVVGVNHMEGHVVGSLLESAAVTLIKSPLVEKIGQLKVSTLKPLRPITFPALALLISGGHTELVLVKKIGDYAVVGRTKDDAVGEAYDKVARMLGLPYPGGPHIHELSEKNRQTQKRNTSTPAAGSTGAIHLPRPMLHSPDLDFSFSGLKTAVLYLLRDIRGTKKTDANNDALTDDLKSEIAREFEDAVTEVLVTKTEKALEEYGVQALILGGGVIANPHIRKAFQTLADKHSIPLYLPPDGVSGDNALMIALAGALNNVYTPLRAHGNLSLGSATL